MSILELKEKLSQIKLRTGTKKNKLHQTDSRTYKALVHELFKTVNDETLDMDMTEIENALFLEIPHDELGAIGVKITFALQPLDYDINALESQYLEKLDKAEQRKIAKKNHRTA